MANDVGSTLALELQVKQPPHPTVKHKLWNIFLQKKRRKMYMVYVNLPISGEF